MCKGLAASGTRRGVCVVAEKVAPRRSRLDFFRLQVSSQARREGQAEAYKRLHSAVEDTDVGVREALAAALRDCLYFDALCQPGLADLARILSTGELWHCRIPSDQALDWVQLCLALRACIEAHLARPGLSSPAAVACFRAYSLVTCRIDLHAVEAISGGAGSDGRHWMCEGAHQPGPNIVSAKVDFAGLQPFVKALLVDEAKAEVQVRSFAREYIRSDA